MVDFTTLDDVLCLLVDLIADGLGVVACRGNKEVQRLHTSIAGTLGHNIKQFSVRLRVQLIKYNTVGVEAVLVSNICGKHLVDTACGQINQTLLGIKDFDPLCQSRTHTHHVGSYIKNDGCLLSVSGAAVDLSSLLTITAGQQKRNSGSQFGLALFLGDFDICGIKLAIAVGLQCSENVSDDLFLPVDQFKGLSCPGAFRMAKALNETDRIVSGILIVVGAFGHEAGRFVFLQLSDMRSPPSNEHKK